MGNRVRGRSRPIVHETAVCIEARLGWSRHSPKKKVSFYAPCLAFALTAGATKMLHGNDAASAETIWS